MMVSRCVWSWVMNAKVATKSATFTKVILEAITRIRGETIIYGHEHAQLPPP